MEIYANRHRLEGLSLKEGDKVYLLRRNIKIIRLSSKLDFKKLGPYLIERRIGKVNYKLTLPDNMKIHLVFHVLLLEPAPKGVPIVDDIELETYENEYIVEKIVDARNDNGKVKYLVKWKDWDDSENIWEPIEHLLNY